MALTDATKEKMQEMHAAGMQYAFSRSRRHPSAVPYLYGAKNRTDLFDLEKTTEALDRAVAFVAEVASAGKRILFVSGKAIARDAVRGAAERTGQFYVAGRWMGGTLTNWSEVKKRLARLEKLQHDKEVGELSKYTKRERLLLDREIEDLEHRFGGLAGMKELPAVLIVIDAKEERTAVREARAKGIPVVSFSGSDCNHTESTYPIPGNDVSRASIQYVVNALAEAYEHGKSRVKSE